MTWPAEGEATIGSVFSGVGGLDLAVESVLGARVVWSSEIDPYAAHVLAKNFPGVPNLGDIRKIRNPPRVDVMCGGFPCQDVSQAGKRVGLSGDRSSLWWEWRRILCEIEPRLVAIENVEGLRRPPRDDDGQAIDEAPIGAVLGSLARLGLDAEWASVSAADVGGTQRRRRVFILAYRDRGDLRQLAERIERLAAERRHGQPLHVGLELAHANGDGLEGRGPKHDFYGRDASWGDPHGRDQGVVYPPPPDDGDDWSAWIRDGGPAPGVRRSSYGPAEGVDARRRRGRLRCLGNAVAPRPAAAALRALILRGAA